VSVCLGHTGINFQGLGLDMEPIPAYSLLLFQRSAHCLFACEIKKNYHQMIDYKIRYFEARLNYLQANAIVFVTKSGLLVSGSQILTFFFR